MFSLPLLAAAAIGPRAAALAAMTPDLMFPDKGEKVVKTFAPIDPGMNFNEAIVSWNVENPANAAVKVETRAIGDGLQATKWYTLADWTYDAKEAPRVSVKGQKDDAGNVLTDTLRLGVPARSLEVMVTLRNLGDGPKPRLKLVTVAFSNTAIPGTDSAVRSPAWGKTVDVPQRAQGNYPNGGVLCSPTSVSMLLWHYANTLNRPELNHDVPEVQAGVWDSVYKGAGNWPFNTAYAGSFSGMRGYVSRFSAISDLEKWIADGLPVACSVSFDMLRGKPLSPTESGHLVVLVGFTETGDPVINDPAFKDGVRKVYKRSDFEKAWKYSHRTVYLIYPEAAQTPVNADGLWMGATE